MIRVKEVLCIHHSHLDIGYTHHQEMLTELQIQFISQAIALCEESAETHPENPLRWTIEATLPLTHWLADATDEEVVRLKKLIQQKIISITALPFHSTPLNDAFQLKKMLDTKEEIEQILDIKITTAINHDINGQSWTFADMLIEAGVDFYLTGENIHFGGLPFPRPKAFYWESPSQRKILSFLGEHYSMLTQFLETPMRDISLMKQGLDKYLAHLEKKGYQEDYIILTATNTPLTDNNPPDSGLLDLVTKFNQTYPEIQIRFVTPEMLRDRILQTTNPIEIKAGDWTDFWNFGSGSTPKEIIANREAIQNIKHATALAAIEPIRNKQFQRVRAKALENSLLFNEHTWGAGESIWDSYSRMSVSQSIKKANYAYDALGQSAFILNQAIDNYLDLDLQYETIDAWTYTNLGNFSQVIDPLISTHVVNPRPHLSAIKAKRYFEVNPEYENLIAKRQEIAPYETVVIPLTEFKAVEKKEIYLNENFELDTPYYLLTFDSKTKQMKQIFDKKRESALLGEEEFGFFDLVIETIDEEKNKPERATFFPRDIELANFSISIWNHDWLGKRTIYQGNSQLTIQKVGYRYYIIQREMVENSNVEWLERIIIIDEASDEIEVNVKLKSLPYTDPISYYLTLPTTLDKDWQSVFESSDTMVLLDEEQLGTVSKDWVTIGNSVSFFDEKKGLYLAAKDSPLLQYNKFQFGKENTSIQREESPLFLSWIYNNYWDTNFKASDDGVISYKYLVKPFSEYQPIEQYELGEKVRQPIVSSWGELAHTPKTPFKVTSESGVILSMEPFTKNEILIFVKNISEKPTTMSITSGREAFVKAMLTDMTGKMSKENLTIEDQTITFSMTKNEIKFVVLTMNEELTEKFKGS